MDLSFRVKGFARFKTQCLSKNTLITIGALIKTRCAGL